MIPVKELLKTTGYIRGGCSPLGMKKQFPTFIDESAELHETIVFSGGNLGIQLEMAVKDLLSLWIVSNFVCNFNQSLYPGSGLSCLL